MDRVANIGGKSTVQVKTHDQVVITTPGVGGYGSATWSRVGAQQVDFRVGQCFMGRNRRR